MQYRILLTFGSLDCLERPVVRVNMRIRLRITFQEWRIIIQVALEIKKSSDSLAKYIFFKLIIVA